MQKSFIFGGNTNLSYDQIQKQRDIANELLRANMSTPQNVGEGLSAIGRALAAKAIDKRTTRADDANRKAYESTKTDAFAALGGYGGGASGGSGGGYGGSSAPFKPSTDPAQSVANDTMAVLGNFGTLEQQHALPAGYLERTYQIESGGNPRAQNPNSSAGGGFQFIDSTAKAYGLTDKFDLGASAAAAARLAADNKAQLTQALGREPTAGELYLAHQQGGGGAAKLLANPNARAVDIVGADAVRLNAGNENMTAGEFAGKWVNKFGGGAAPQPAAGGAAMPNPAVLMQLAEIQGNPYASDSDKAIANLLMNQTVQAMDPMRKVEMERARLELDALKNPQPQPGFQMLTDEQEAQMGLNPAGVYQQGPDGALKVVQDAPKGSPRPMTAEERAAWGIAPEDTTPYAIGDDGLPKAISGGGVTVNNDLGGGKFDDEFAKGDAASLVAVSDAGNAAIRNLGRIDQLEGLLAASPTGAGAALAQAAGEFGINTEGLDEIQSAQAIINSLVPEQRQPGSGPMSDADLALFKQSLPRIINQPGGNQTIIQTMRAIAQYDAEGAQIVQQLRAGEIKRAEAFDRLQARKNPLEGFKAPAATKTPGPDAIDFSNMSAAELADVDINSLTPEQMDAMLKRFDEVGQ